MSYNWLVLFASNSTRKVANILFKRLEKRSSDLPYVLVVQIYPIFNSVIRITAHAEFHLLISVG